MSRMSDSEFEQFYSVLKRGDVIALRRMIAAGGNVNVRNRFGWTPLMSCGGNTACIAILLEAGADVNAINQFGESALACAAQQGYPRAVRMLLRAGARADVEPHGCSLLTYVMTGSGHDSLSVIDMLKAAGATELRGNTHCLNPLSGMGPVNDLGRPEGLS
jgi:ankyrin repeat protein